METIYRKVFIKSEADLPEDKAEYFVHIKERIESLYRSGINTLTSDYPEDLFKEIWMNNIDWYLQPVELPSDEEIDKAGAKYEKEYQEAFNTPEAAFAAVYANEDFVAGMKLLRDKLINK